MNSWFAAEHASLPCAECPAGFKCPTDAMTVPLPCSTFCPPGFLTNQKKRRMKKKKDKIKAKKETGRK